MGLLSTKTPIILQTNRKSYNTKFRIQTISSSAFCNRVEAAGKTCTFCECDSDCSAEEYVIGDQIVIGTTNETIRGKAMIKNWKLAELRQKGMKYASAAAGEEKISGSDVNKVGAYSYQRVKNKKTKLSTKKCYRYSSPFKKMLQMQFAIQKNAIDAVRHSVLNT